MELRRLLICLAFFVLAVSQCSEARHSVRRREADEVNYDDSQMADEANDDDGMDNEFADDEPEKAKVEAVIVTKGSKYNVTRGRTVRLECTVNPDSGTVVQWYKDNVMYFLGSIRTYENTRFSIVPDSKDLLIKDVEASDAGIYRCEVVNANQAVNHTLTIFEAPRIIRFTATNNGTVLEGSDLLLTCDVSGIPAPKVFWSFDDEQGNRALTEKDGEFSGYTVFIRNVNSRHSGTYYCYAMNDLGNDQAKVKVAVSNKVRVHVHRTVVNSALNVEAVLECTAHEDNSPHMRWYKDGRLIESAASQYQISTNGPHSNLTVIPKDDDDFGTFTCEAENVNGKHNRSIELVQSPVIEELGFEGPKLSWTVHSHQPLEEIEVQLKNTKGESDWKMLSVPIPESKHHRYEVVYLLDDKELDEGTYEVVVKARNDHSWSNSERMAAVEIEPQPQLIQHASVYRGASHSIRPTSAILFTMLTYLLVRMI